MFLRVDSKINKEHENSQNVNFREAVSPVESPLSAPIDAVKKTIEESVDTFSGKIENSSNSCMNQYILWVLKVTIVNKNKGTKLFLYFLKYNRQIDGQLLRDLSFPLW